MIERAVFEVPNRLGFRVSDITIGGESITVGGQLAEYITVKLVGLVSELGKYSNSPAPCEFSCCADAANPSFVYFQPLGMPCPPGRIPAFDYLVPHEPAVGSPPATAHDRPPPRASDRRQ